MFVCLFLSFIFGHCIALAFFNPEKDRTCFSHLVVAAIKLEKHITLHIRLQTFSLGCIFGISGFYKFLSVIPSTNRKLECYRSAESIKHIRIRQNGSRQPARAWLAGDRVPGLRYARACFCFCCFP